MKSVILWNKTSEKLPEQTEFHTGVINKLSNEEIINYIDDACLVIWEGHTKDQAPEYWVKIKDILPEE